MSIYKCNELRLGVHHNGIPLVTPAEELSFR
jgi:hypothetical protein